jgi:hypothetical protein
VKRERIFAALQGWEALRSDWRWLTARRERWHKRFPPSPVGPPSGSRSAFKAAEPGAEVQWRGRDTGADPAKAPAVCAVVP